MEEWIILENTKTDALEPRRATYEKSNQFLLITFEDGLRERIAWKIIDQVRQSDDSQRISQSDILR